MKTRLVIAALSLAALGQSASATAVVRGVNPGGRVW